MVVWSCNSIFYQIILEMHLRKYLTWKGDNKFQNSAPNFRRCISKMSTRLINYEYISKNSRDVYMDFFKYSTRVALTWFPITLVHCASIDASPNVHFSIFAWCVSNIYGALRNFLLKYGVRFVWPNPKLIMIPH